MKQDLIAVQNMKCQGCVNSIAQMLGSYPEIIDLKIDLEAGTVRITSELDDQRSKYVARLAQAGYPEIQNANTAA
jgi:copper chaperone